MKLLFIFNIFILSVFSSPILNIDKPIVQGGIPYSQTRLEYCSQTINSILISMNHVRETWSTDFNYRQMELLRMNEQCVKFSETNRGRDVPFVNGK